MMLTFRLGLPTAHIVILLLYAGQRMKFPDLLAIGDLPELERICIEAIAEFEFGLLKTALTPSWPARVRAVGAG